MGNWILVPCLVTLRQEFNTLAPSRDKGSDGSIGNQEHAAGSSDHNPDETGITPYEDGDDRNEVHAIDVDDSGPWPAGWDFDRDGVQVVIDRHRRGLDDRLQNVIRNGQIYSRSWGWTARPYSGANAHREHAHFSARYSSAQEADTSPWGLLQEVDMNKAELLEVLNSDAGQAAIRKAVASTKTGSKVYAGRDISDMASDLHAFLDDWVGDGKGAAARPTRDGSLGEKLRALAVADVPAVLAEILEILKPAAR